ncbi:MAG: amidohydrolase family protein [Nitrososphaerales archaeon]
MSEDQFCVLPLPKRQVLLIKNAKAILAEQASPADGIAIIDGVIQCIANTADLRRQFGKFDEEIDATNCLVVPGFVNNHSHVAMSLLRGLAEDLPLLDWLKNRIWPLEAKLKPWHIEVGALLGSAEALLSGTTTITSIYFYDPSGSEASAALATGIRGVFAHGVFDWTEEKALAATRAYVEHFHGKDSGRIRIATSPHAPYSCSPKLLKTIEDLRQNLNLQFGKTYPVLNTIHVAEARTEPKDIEKKYGVDVSKGVVYYLHSLGVIGPETIAAHCIHLTEHDYVALQKSQTTIASCPVSNLKVGMGVANLQKALSHNILVSLGTDGPASNNTLDMFETCKVASLLAKGLSGDTTALSSRESFSLGTINGARSLHQNNEIGSLREGKRADIVILDLSSANAIPYFDPYNYLVYSAKSSDVRDVIVDGRILVRNRALLTVDLEKLASKVSQAVSEIQT